MAIYYYYYCVHKLFRFFGVFNNLAAFILVLWFVVFNGKHFSPEQVAFSSFRSVLRIVIYGPREMPLLQMRSLSHMKWFCYKCDTVTLV